MLKHELAVQIGIRMSYLVDASEFYTEVYEEGLIDESYAYDFSLEKGFGFALIGSDSHQPDELDTSYKRAIKKTEQKWPFR